MRRIKGVKSSQLKSYYKISGRYDKDGKYYDFYEHYLNNEKALFIIKIVDKEFEYGTCNLVYYNVKSVKKYKEDNRLVIDYVQDGEDLTTVVKDYKAYTITY